MRPVLNVHPPELHPRAFAAGPVKGGTTVIAFVQDPDGYKVSRVLGELQHDLQLLGISATPPTLTLHRSSSSRLERVLSRPTSRMNGPSMRKRLSRIQ